MLLHHQLYSDKEKWVRRPRSGVSGGETLKGYGQKFQFYNERFSAETYMPTATLMYFLWS